MPEFDADYKFLMDYLDNIQNAKEHNPNDSLEDDNSFYGNDSDDDEKEYQDLYGDEQDTSSETEDESDPYEKENDSDSDDADAGYDNQGYSQNDYSTMPEMGTAHDIDFSHDTSTRDLEDAKKGIIEQESGGKYSALNPHSTAVGKYQFLWGKHPGQGWQDSIKKITGVKTKEEFRKSPAAQEKFYSWYAKKVLAPEAVKLKPYNKKNLTDSQLEKLIHFRGTAGAKKYLLGQLSDKPETYNTPISSYIGTKQTGGAVAMNPAAQHMGLNNPSFSEMTFPMEGEHVFRGLDDSTHVYVEDETGKSDILVGPKHKKKFKGKVKEIKLR